MPITLYNENGDPVEVPSAEEIEALKQSQTQVEALLKEKEELEKEVNPNWRAIRKANDDLRKALKDKGVEVDENGTVIEKKEISKDEIIGETRKIVLEESYNSEKERLFANLSDADRKTVEVYLEKLMSGEEKTISNLNKYYNQTIDFVFPGQESKARRVVNNISGHGPNLSNEGKPTEGAVTMGKSFGLTDKDLAESSDPVIQF